MLPILPESPTFSNADIQAFLNMLDTGQALDKVQAVRWRCAIEDGRWTVEEAMSAARWLNLNRTGYVNIAHVHERIKRERELLKAAKFLSFEHPAVVKALGFDSPDAAAEARNRDIVGWNATTAEQVWPMFTRSQWIEWMETPRSERLSALRRAFEQ